MPRERAKERSCDYAIKNTLAYSAVFNYPLSFSQLATYLMADRHFDYNFFAQSVKRVLKGKSIKVKDQRFTLPSIKPVSWDLRSKYSKELLEKNKEELKLLSKIPWIKMIGITGSVAALNAEKDSDTDLFIVTRKNRLWLTRGFVIALLILLRKYPNRESENIKICPNIYLDEEHLMWPSEKHNIYTAHEVILLQPYFDKDNTYFKFLKANEWAFKYFPNFKITFPKRFKHSNPSKSLMVSILENLSMKMELNYMKKRKTIEVTTKHMIHFNKSDSSIKIMDSYKQILSKISK